MSGKKSLLEKSRRARGERRSDGGMDSRSAVSGELTERKLPGDLDVGRICLQ